MVMFTMRVQLGHQSALSKPCITSATHIRSNLKPSIDMGYLIG